MLYNLSSEFYFFRRNFHLHLQISFHFDIFVEFSMFFCKRAREKIQIDTKHIQLCVQMIFNNLFWTIICLHQISIIHMSLGSSGHYKRRRLEQHCYHTLWRSRLISNEFQPCTYVYCIPSSWCLSYAAAFSDGFIIVRKDSAWPNPDWWGELH